MSAPGDTGRAPDSSAETSAQPAEASRDPAVRFTPGTMLAGRYRVVGPLGKGGMGEVYRADDVKLGQTVALKLLPESLKNDPGRLARFHNEVRIAREVTHPNVCRVHDIGEADGLPFISMEYVDGEDLSSLLRRIGRLPKDKGIEIARQLCAGLAAAHDQGVLHRDLKPANVMIDGRGRVRIADFGLAGIAEQIGREDMASGTPAYMAPEQFAGKDVSIRSDIYSLGLVLYEVFTGRRPFEGKTLAELVRGHQTTPPPSPSGFAAEIDPVLERAILRCLEKDPAARPASAVAVAAALPGGDPLAAALAAGVTPSPEMVAAAGDVGGLRPAVAWAYLLGFVLCLALLFAVMFRWRPNLIQHLPLERSPQVLADKSREILKKLRGSARPVDRAFGLAYNADIVRYITQRDPSPTRWKDLATGQPHAVYFWYRESPQPLVSQESDGIVGWGDPPAVVRGMINMGLDTQGRLVYLRAIPPLQDDAKEKVVATDWAALFAEAGLELARFRPADAVWVPPVWGDAREGWDGVYTDRPEIPIHVEAAAYRGKPVYFEIFGPWRQQAVAAGSGFAGWNLMNAAILALGALLARRNLRLGRGDRRGALRLSSFVIGIWMLRWLFTASHVGDGLSEWSLFTRAARAALFEGATFWLYYIALEPYVRRLWPETLVSWSRLLSGRFRDPMVGRDILIGSLAGLASPYLAWLVILGPGWLGSTPRVSSAPSLVTVLGGRYLAGWVFGAMQVALQLSVLMLVLLLLLRILLRRPLLVAGAFVLVMSLPSVGLFGSWFGGFHPLDPFFLGAMYTVMYSILTRLGLLAMVASALPMGLSLFYPVISFDLSAWHAGILLTVVAVLLSVAAYGFYTALAGQPLYSIKDDV